MVASWSCCDIGHEVPEMDGNALLTGGVLIGVRKTLLPKEGLNSSPFG